MKKTLLSLFAALSLGSASAQIIWQDNFNAPTPPALPSNWTQYNGDGLTVASNLSAFNFGTNAWVSAKYSGSTTDNYLASTSWYTPAGTSNDWLISPALNPVAGAYLVFSSQAGEGSPYNDGFKVRISTTTNAYTSFTAAPLLTVAAENTTWTTHAIDLSAYAGQTVYIAFVNDNFDKNRLHLDNVKLQILPSKDAALLDMIPRTATHKSYATVGGTIPVQGLLQNLGSTNITSYTIKVNDGVSTQSFPQTGNIASFATQVFSLNYPMATTGIKPIKMWVELPGDADLSNDSTFSEFGGATFSPTHRNIFEEATGTWCGWCPRGTVFMDSVHAAHPDDIYVAVHNGDPMTVTAYDDGLTALPGFSGFPSVAVGRSEIIDPSDMFTAYTDHKADFGVADLTVAQPVITGSSMSVKVDAKMAISTKPNYDYRLALVVTKDDDHGTSSAWNQANYYSGAAAPNLIGAGFNWDNEADPVAASKMYYDFVAKDIVGGFEGVSGSLPGTMTAGSTYSYTFNWAIPSTLELAKTKVNVILISGLSGEAQNGAWKGAYPTSVNDVVANSNLNIFPNPSNNFVNVDFTLNKISNVTISMFDVTGKAVYTNHLSNLNGNQGLVINTSAMSNGVYTLALVTSEGTITRKVTVAH
ncbi:MAG TPA: choice-of-anchor J domain-containing protein [Chitinophagaceae bacterium]|nr:choice-of-anchor J domain-containing protein [Chitinophagaceae bacterium]